MNVIEEAIELFRQGRPREAAYLCDRRLAIAPHELDTLSLLAEILAASGANERAALVLGEIIALRPEDAGARRRLGAVLLALGRDAEAAEALRAALQVDPASCRAHNNLGQALLRLKRLPEAIASLQAALRLEPGYAIADVNLGLAYDGCDQPADALAAYDRALATAPNLVEAWAGRGVVLAKLHHPELALQSLARALDLKPGDAVTLTHQAVVLLSMERAAESLMAADAALHIDDRLPPAHNARAAALRRLARRAEAASALERALKLDPQYVDAWGNLGTVLHEIGRFEEAVAACRRAFELDPTGIQTRTRMLARLIPSVPESSEEALVARRAFDRELAELQTWLGGQMLSQRDALAAAQQQFFYLAYEEQSNRSVLHSYRSACAARLADLEDGAAPRVRATGQRASARFKVGFVSAHVYDHSVFHAILHGWLQSLSRECFELSLFSLGSRQDACTQDAIGLAEHVDTGPRGISDWARAIRDRDLDAIVYPELGMNETTLALASLRLAPRQFVAWGHPETSGLPTMDGYLSADLFEPPEASDHYSEALVRLPNLGVHCRPYAVETARVDLESLGIAPDRPLFICPGVPFKYRPQDDWIWVEIARRVGRCTFVFFQHEIAELSRKLEARLAAAFARGRLDPQDHVRMIPWQPRAAFFGLLSQADVYLDTIGFSGFNTVMQAMQCHLPCITHEGRFLRGRLGSGILKRLNLPQWIARDAHDYIELAVQLAGDGARRDETRAAIRAAEHRLYQDSSAVAALSALLASHNS